VAGCCEHGNEPSGSKKSVEFFCLSDDQLLKMDSTLHSKMTCKLKVKVKLSLCFF
jgi:hypothetical protein